MEDISRVNYLVPVSCECGSSVRKVLCGSLILGGKSTAFRHLLGNHVLVRHLLSVALDATAMRLRLLLTAVLQVLVFALGIFRRQLGATRTVQPARPLPFPPSRARVRCWRSRPSPCCRWPHASAPQGVHTVVAARPKLRASPVIADRDRLHAWACETRTRKCQFGLSI